MSLDLLKERFGGSTSTNKKEVDKKKLNEIFNSNPIGNLESFKSQHQGELEEKDKIIENLIQELNQQKLENKLALNTKKIYEDKIEKISILDFSKELISMLTDESRKKQGNQILDWKNWLKISENKYLLQINEDVAKKVFEDSNYLISQYNRFDRVNKLDWPYKPEAGRTSRTRGGDVAVENYNIKFGGQEGNRAYVQTGFKPDDNGVDLRLGFTVSYWVRPDAVSTSESDTVPMFALGRKHNNNQRFTFGINTNKAIYVAFGGKKITTNYLAMGVNTNPNLSHLLNDDNSLKTGNWINFVITYADRSDVTDDADLKIYMNGELIKTNDDKWTQQGGGTGGLMLGARNLVGAYNRGWDCGLDEVAIYDTGKGTSFAQEVYNGGINYDHKDSGGDGLVAYWKMNEGSGNTVIDHSGNGYNGTLETDGTGLPTWEER